MKYILLICLSTPLFYLRNSKRGERIILAILLIAFAMLAAEGSWDYAGYLEYYDCSVSTSCDNFSFEESYKYISRLSNAVFNENGFFATLFLYCSISIFIKLRFLSKYSVWFGASVFAFICYGFFIHEMTQIRASLAIALFWLALERLVSKDNLKFWVYIVAASLIHTSAIIGSAAYLYSRLPSKFLFFCIPFALIIGKVFYFFEIPSYFECDSCGRMGIYMDAFGQSLSGPNQLPFYLIFILLMSLLFFYLVDQRSLMEEVALKSAIFGVTIYLAIYSIPVISVRILEFFSSLYPLIVASIFNTSKNIRDRVLIGLCCVALFANLALRNNTRVDLIMSHHVFSEDLMTDTQFKHFLKKSIGDTESFKD
jgi:hypothetical protein